MLAKRIIACLDVRDGLVVKGVQFEGLRTAGDPAALARRYDGEGIDEVVILDVTATLEARQARAQTIRAVARELFLPLCVGGGIRTEDDAAAAIDAGADKVSLNSAALADPCADHAAGRTLRQPGGGGGHRRQAGRGGWTAYTRSGSADTSRDVVAWAREAAACGAGEILLTSIDRDGTKAGFDCALTAAVSDAVAIPVIASGGAGGFDHFVEVFTDGHADAALAASIFHFDTHAVSALKQHLAARAVPVRCRGLAQGTGLAPTRDAAAQFAWSEVLHALARSRRPVRADGTDRAIGARPQRQASAPLNRTSSRDQARSASFSS